MKSKKGLLKRFTDNDISKMKEILNCYKPQVPESMSKYLLLEYLDGDVPMTQVLERYHINKNQWSDLKKEIFRNRLFFGDNVNLLDLSSEESRGYRWSIINEMSKNVSWIDSLCLVPSSYIYYNDEDQEVVTINHKNIVGRAIFKTIKGNFDINVVDMTSSVDVATFLMHKDVASLTTLSGLSLSSVAKLGTDKANVKALVFLETLDMLLIDGIETILVLPD